MNYQECVEQLKHSTRIIQEDNLSIREKPIPDDDRPGIPDPRVLLGSKVKKPFPAPKNTEHITLEEIYRIRAAMGCKNMDLSHNVTKETRTIATDAGDVPVLVYSPEALKDRAIVIYIHGGGFLGGTTRVVENACKLLADRAEAVVISVDYALAPEHPFPEGLMQCWQVVCWAHEHGKELGGNPEKLVVMGDSAGGNLSVGCSMLDEEHRIKLQVLLYPTVVMDPDYDGWNDRAYTINEEKELLSGLIQEVNQMKGSVYSTYVTSRDKLKNPLISPLLAKDLSKLPTTLMITAEYDSLRLEEEEFAKRLLEDGVDVIFYRYNGMGHAFFEHTGEFPQAEDCTDEIANAIKML